MQTLYTSLSSLPIQLLLRSQEKPETRDIKIISATEKWVNVRCFSDNTDFSENDELFRPTQQLFKQTKNGVKI